MALLTYLLTMTLTVATRTYLAEAVDDDGMFRELKGARRARGALVNNPVVELVTYELDRSGVAPRAEPLQ